MLWSCQAQPDTVSAEHFTFHINPTVLNKGEEHASAIIAKWEEYLTSGEFLRPENSHWAHEGARTPDYFMADLLFQIMDLKESGGKMQASVLGVHPVEHDHYAIKTMFTRVNDSTGQVALSHITTVYAKQIEGEYKLVPSAIYQRLVLESHTVGAVTYYVHPAHPYDEKAAQQMNAYNYKLAALYDMKPIKFDYFVSSYAREVLELMGYDFMPFSLQAVQSGGMADIINSTVYAGNNSEFYPHEVVHLYHAKKYPHQSHRWFDEGIAALIGGSTGYPLEWHMQKLQAFLKEEPDYEIKDLAALQVDIPNGEYISDMRYVIGGLIAQKIYEKEGMPGLFEALQGGRSDADYFRIVKEKLGVERDDFGDYVKAEVAAYDVNAVASPLGYQGH